MKDKLLDIARSTMSLREQAIEWGVNREVMNFLKGYFEASLCERICSQCGEPSLLRQGSRCPVCGEPGTGMEPYWVRPDQLHITIRSGRPLPDLWGGLPENADQNLERAKNRFDVETVIDMIEDVVTPETIAAIIRNLRPDLFSVLVNTPSQKDDDELVTCEECGEEFRFIDPLHLSMEHGLTVKKYQDRYGKFSLGTLEGCSGAKWLRTQSLIVLQELRELIRNETK